MKIINLDESKSKYDSTVGKKIITLNKRKVILKNRIVEETVNKINCESGKYLPKEFRYFLDGLLLGDGSINSNKAYISRMYEHATISLEWLNIIKLFFKKYDIWSKIYQLPNKEYKLVTDCIPEFNWFRDRWYREKEDTNQYFKYDKIIPCDLDLTPHCIANWYMGDGSLLKPSGYAKQFGIKLATHSFSYNDVVCLKDTLNMLLHTKFSIIKESKYKDEGYYHTLRLYGNDKVKSFLDYVKSHIIPYFEYKYQPFYNDLIIKN